MSEASGKTLRVGRLSVSGKLQVLFIIEAIKRFKIICLTLVINNSLQLLLKTTFFSTWDRICSLWISPTRSLNFLVRIPLNSEFLCARKIKYINLTISSQIEGDAPYTWLSLFLLWSPQHKEIKSKTVGY